MNKSESKYFNTAVCMDEALLALLEKKDFSYITIKEICEKAGVNRSTFYLHYETISDLLEESIQYMYRRFLSYMDSNSIEIGFVDRIRDCAPEELYLVTPEYLKPYLNYIKENRRFFRTAVEHSNVLRMEDTYDKMFRHVFTPILERYEVSAQDRQYIMTFYVNGLMAIITMWLKNDCSDSIDHIIAVIRQCVS